jgi:hypothetical protein
MSVFSSIDIENFRNAQIGSFNSTCTINRISITTDTYGDVVKTTTSASGVSCGFSLTGGIKTIRGTTVIVDYDGTLRLPVSGSPIGLNDTITIINHMGNTVNDTFEVYSVPELNTCMVIKLKRKSN